MPKFRVEMHHAMNGTTTVDEYEARDLADLHEQHLKGTEWVQIRALEVIEQKETPQN